MGGQHRSASVSPSPATGQQQHQIPEDEAVGWRDSAWIIVPFGASIFFIVLVAIGAGRADSLTHRIARAALIDLGISAAAGIIVLIITALIPGVFIWAVFAACLLISIIIISFHAAIGIIINISIFAFFLYTRRQIPFAAATMKATAPVLLRNPSSLAIAALAMTVVTGLYITGAVLLSMPNAFLPGVLIQHYLVQLTTMIGFAAVSGMAASQFLMPGEQAPSAWGALVRATTTSLGTIAAAAVPQSIVTVINFFLLVIPIPGWCIRLCLGTAFGSFRTYLLCYVSIYGSPLRKATGSATQLMRSSGTTALVNDGLIEPVLNLVTFVAALTSGLIVGAVDPTDRSEDFLSEHVLVVIFSIFIAVMLSNIALQPIRAAAATLMVCWTEDPQAVRGAVPPADYSSLVNAARALHPDLNERFVQL